MVNFSYSGILGRAASRWQWTTTWWPGHTLVAVISVLPCRARKKPSPSTNEQWEFGPLLCVICVLRFLSSLCVCVCLVKLSHVGFLTIWVLTQRHVFWKEEGGGFAWSDQNEPSFWSTCIVTLFVQCIFSLARGTIIFLCCVLSWRRGTTTPKRAQIVTVYVLFSAGGGARPHQGELRVSETLDSAGSGAAEKDERDLQGRQEHQFPTYPGKSIWGKKGEKPTWPVWMLRCACFI